MTNESYGIAKKQETILSNVLAAGATRTLLAKADGNRTRIRFSTTMNADLSTVAVGVSILVPNGLSDCIVGILSCFNPVCELSLENHGDVIYNSFFMTDDTGLNPNIGVVQTRIITQV